MNTILYTRRNFQKLSENYLGDYTKESGRCVIGKVKDYGEEETLNHMF